MNIEEATELLGKAQIILSHQAKQESEIIGLKKSESFKYHQAIQKFLEEYYFNSISKDKIREKINKYNNIRQTTNDDDIYKAMVNYLDILEELLEE